LSDARARLAPAYCGVPESHPEVIRKPVRKLSELRNRRL
jgi:hypothetical protein